MRSVLSGLRCSPSPTVNRLDGVLHVAGDLEVDGTALKDEAHRAEAVLVLSGGSLAGNVQLRWTADGHWEIQGDPTEAAFLVAERKLGVHERRVQSFERVGEIPFTSERKMMSTIEMDHEHGDERVLIAKGAPDVLLERCTRAHRHGSVPLDDGLRQRILADVESLTDAALRTLAVAYRPLRDNEDTDPLHASRLERDLVFAGTVGIIDQPREEAAQAMPKRRAGAEVGRHRHRHGHRRHRGHEGSRTHDPTRRQLRDDRAGHARGPRHLRQHEWRTATRSR